MFKKLFIKFFYSRNTIVINKLKKIVVNINNLGKYFSKLSDKELKKKTKKFRIMLNQKINLNKLIPESFALVKEACKRVFNINYFDVQLIGGIILHKGNIAEICTGEGKTLISILPIYLNSLLKKGVHVITTNEYLAKRDLKNNKPLFDFLDIKIGINLKGMDYQEKTKVYKYDVTYGTSSEFCFDYLRDNMLFNLKKKVQRKLNYVLIDEVDSVLIDNGKNPLIISSIENKKLKIYSEINKIVKLLKNNSKCYYLNKNEGQLYLKKYGLIAIEKILIKNKIIKKNKLYLRTHILFINHIVLSLKSHLLFKKNIDYIVKKKKIIIIDKNTGRLMYGKKWSDGLHQAIESKENLKVNSENEIFNSITIQNYFCLYKKISGMTGTAITESEEFYSIYNLETFLIPTHFPIIRKDLPDLLYITKEEKYNSIVLDIKKRIKKMQPILVGTISIEESELISKILNKEKIKHQVLNAKFHSKEAHIISKAGKPCCVTISTNMAGRGTDIVLGGNLKNKIIKSNILYNEEIIKIKNKWKKNNKIVLLSGGLHVIGVSHYESKRIDNQLRGRSGRQGDPGSSRFYVSLEDQLINIFISKNIINILKKINIKYGKPIEHNFINKIILNAQNKIESNNFNIRKNLFKYDNIINIQRNIIYYQRNKILNINNIDFLVKNLFEEILSKIVDKYIINSLFFKSFEIDKLCNILYSDFNLKIPILGNLKKIKKNKLFIKKIIIQESIKLYLYRSNKIDNNIMNNIEKNIILKNIDLFWKNHLINLQILKKSVNLKFYNQQNPIQEYKIESYKLFINMIESLKYKILSNLNIIQTKILNENILIKNKKIYLNNSLFKSRLYSKYNLSYFINNIKNIFFRKK
ncbi:preprotein translocase subunit SecA [Candidatus Annandia pinicola]|uniref:preprotein translocase subunit SecA n=1 Tax=Candidatus Annandia pinicola TaxID=1345117 RepID=UPI001D030023|nr:preprotein translocase subunit SecA [Candidatus Annandia pinicola]UDG80454.1 Protein translocase subunit SecA [Candidatus Annandia pinicola]